MILLDIFNPYSVVLAGFGTTAALQGRDTWLLADFCGSVLAGLIFFFVPKAVLSLQTDVKLDIVSLQMARALGSLLITTGLNACAVYASHDEEAKEGHIRSRVLGNIALLMAMVYAQVHYPEWNLGHVKLGFVGCIIWTLPYLAYTFLYLSSGKNPTTGHSKFLQVDSLGAYVSGLAFLAFPQWILRHQVSLKLNGVSVHMARAFGCMLLGSSVFTNAATSFMSTDTKKATLLARGFGASLLTLVSIIAQASGRFSKTHFVTGVMGSTIWAANSFLGYMMINYTTNMELMHGGKDRAGEGFHDVQKDLGYNPKLSPFSPSYGPSHTSLHPFASAYDVAAAAMGGFEGHSDSSSVSDAVRYALKQPARVKKTT